jgi:hypothetical protein
MTARFAPATQKALFVSGLRRLFAAFPHRSQPHFLWTPALTMTPAPSYSGRERISESHQCVAPHLKPLLTAFSTFSVDNRTDTRGCTAVRRALPIIAIRIRHCAAFSRDSAAFPANQKFLFFGLVLSM